MYKQNISLDFNNFTTNTPFLKITEGTLKFFWDVMHFDENYILNYQMETPLKKNKL